MFKSWLFKRILMSRNVLFIRNRAVRGMGMNKAVKKIIEMDRTGWLSGLTKEELFRTVRQWNVLAEAEAP